MDLSGLESLIPPVAQFLGLEPATLLLLIGIAVIVARLAARLIPDDQTGWLGIVRKIASIIAIEIGNRLTRQVTVTDVAKAIVADKVTKLKKEIPAEAKEILREQVPPPEGIDSEKP